MKSPKGIVGFGVDIVQVDRIRRLVDRRPAFLTRLFSSEELAGVATGRERLQYLAARFAAKEAIIKAVGGLRGSRYRQIEILRQPGQAPRVVISGPLGEWLEQYRLDVRVSLSHERDYAVAMALLEGRVGVESAPGVDGSGSPEGRPGHD
ncbi:4'-phosphopantetheinyl transferase [Sulfobacillus acidophilus TPY]|uniref:Holo-[acyl-carrier-protein] synthase n=1 Tax=Sulfobacillus acidophilus (strain ATCC 700253 / DSM 10332 / NAL) TaxID=679936 RepID=G8TXX0_SULAD|nr:4'-phosphopantetheinyl transferase [Sulfobacillus acidophilus TPY]AEW06176.1 holo-(acyl-carrier-protein) synthase [Sulfobacillus acidophilus DSM 10332]